MHVPPPFYLATTFAAGLALQRWHPAPLLPPGWEGVGVIGGSAALAVAGVGGVWAIVTFWRHRTPVIPGRPARAMVTTGPYRFTRNPMYIGLFVLYAGLSLRLNLLWPLLLAPLPWALLQWRIVPREERHLAERFGDAFADYRRRVRRWL